jgi:ferrochelatase
LSAPQKTGVLLINTGSPDSTSVPDVRRYLRQFLSDPRVIDIAPLKRWLLLNLVILRRRPKESAHAYSKIWTDRGSPLIGHSQDLCDGLRAHFPGVEIEIAMAYGKPSVPDQMNALIARGVTQIVAAPMFPQYASATVGSVLELTYKTAAEMPNVPAVAALPPFYDAPAYLDAWAAVARPQLDAFQPDHVLMSFHGLPVRQIYKCDPTGAHCLKKDDCCETYLDGNPMCYRAHCVATAKGIAQRLALSDGDYTLAFQSKLGRDPWLTPATDVTVEQKARDGVKRLAILSPAFVADCIETIEELGIQARESFEENGGEAFRLVSSLNSEPAWVTGFAEILRSSGLVSR